MVLYTKPRAEKRAFEILDQKGFFVYLPCSTILKQWSDRKKKVTEPLFKSYLFIYCPQDMIDIAAREDNIVGIVKFERQPAVVRDEEMAVIRRVEQGEPDVEVEHGSLSVGQKVQITAGGLKGLTGTLTEIRGARKVAIKIESLGVNLLISPGHVEEIK